MSVTLVPRHVVLDEIERLRRALNDHRDVDFRLGAIYALDILRSVVLQIKEA